MNKRKKSYPDVGDHFCGAGGSGQGARQAGLEVKMAANHWKLATNTYQTNFTDTKVYCADITASDPRFFPTTTFGLFSPECTTHSPAGGNTYASFKKQMSLFEKGKIDASAERSRMTMWDVVRFSEYHLYEIVVVENVVEAKTRWPLFDTWLLAMHNLGYLHECLYLNSMHHLPTPQSRDRMYIVFWKKGNPKPDLKFTPEAYCNCCNKVVTTYQWWKNPKKKFGKYGKNGQYLFRCSECSNIVDPFYHAAFNIIDWSIAGKPIIGDDGTPNYSPNTIRRVKYGLDKFGDLALVIGSRYKDGLDCRVKTVFDPINTQPTEASHAFAFPFMIKTDNSKVKDSVTVRSSGNPFRTVTTTDAHGIVIPTIVMNNGMSLAKPSTEAFPSITTEMKHGFINPEALNSFLSYYNGGSQMASHTLEPTGVISTIDRVALVQHKKPTIEECTYRTIRPHEVHKAMAFEDDYVILGNGKERVKQLGNAVTPPVMTWILKRCLASLS